jgi:hypothetical protein
MSELLTRRRFRVSPAKEFCAEDSELRDNASDDGHPENKNRGL